MTGLEWYGAPLSRYGRPPIRPWPADYHDYTKREAIESAYRVADYISGAQMQAIRVHGDFTGEWLADFTPEARARRQEEMDRAWWPEEYGDA